MHEKIYEMLMKEEEVTWQSLLYELVKKEEMDPWDVNVSRLTRKYIDTLKSLKQHDFRVSGKVVLAAAILLKIKSKRLIGEDLMELDRTIASMNTDENEGFIDDYSDSDYNMGAFSDDEKPKLIPRVPQPRKRKVSIYDLVEALEKALEVKQRRVINSAPPGNIHIPQKSRDITQVIREVYGTIKSFFSRTDNKKLMFTNLIPSESKEDKIYTFIPLLHLNYQRKIDIEQQEHFGDISITLYNSKKEVEKELGKV